jgi:aspartyl-tRNA(Asn)/glutamyl-tRNA(Gln) amidotransferase subunit B
MSRYAPIIGLEIHLRLKTKSKMFCRCPNVDEATPPNSSICPVCTGQPGALPVVNEQAIRLGVRAGLALQATIPDRANFDRKNYFYPDLPKGYQISQFDHPIVEKGFVEIPSSIAVSGWRRVGITRAHLEEDAAKNIHDGKTGATFVDFNRAGVPLLEIVTEPDIRSSQEAKTFLQELQAIMRAVGASDADMEKGYMRCDANISVLPIDEAGHPLQKEFNPKVEIKNMNSFRSVERAIEFEITRQSALYDAGEVAKAETRGWNDQTGETISQRTKETSADYRYFPEPDLPSIDLVRFRDDERAHLPELPSASRQRLKEEYGFSEEDTRFLVGNEGWMEFAEHVMDELASWIESSDDSAQSGGEIIEKNKVIFARLVGGWLTNKLAGLLAQQGKTLGQIRLDAENMAELIHLIQTEKINSANAQKLLALMIETGGDPSQLMETHQLAQDTSEEAASALITHLIEQNPDQAAQVRAGKLPVLKWFVGQAMKASQGRLNPTQAESLLKKHLGCE